MAKNFVGNSFCAVFLKISGNEKFMEKRGSESQDFLPKSICLTEQKNFVGEPFLVSQNFRYRKSLWRRRGGVPGFPVENFLSHSAEKIRRGTLLCFSFSGIENISGEEGVGGVSGVFVEMFLSHFAEKFRRGTQ